MQRHSDIHVAVRPQGGWGHAGSAESGSTCRTTGRAIPPGIAGGVAADASAAEEVVDFEIVLRNGGLEP